MNENETIRDAIGRLEDAASKAGPFAHLTPVYAEVRRDDLLVLLAAISKQVA